MSQLQKYAWWNLAVSGLIVVCFLAAVPFMGSRGAWVFFSFGALWAFGAYILWRLYLLRTRRDGKVAMDERDRQIWGYSLLAGYSVFWLAFIAACMLPGHIYGWDGAVPVYILQLYLPGAVCILLLTQSIAILIQYARGTSHASE